jgi:hypothetical protein
MFGGQSATYTVQTRGADPAVLQGLADALHDAFVEDLKAAGYEVVPPAELLARPEFQELRGAGKPSPLVEEVGTGRGRGQTMSVQVLAAAHGLPVLRGAVPDERWLPPTLDDGMKARAYTLGGAKASFGLKAALLNVRLTLSMTEPKGKGSGGVSTFGNLRIASASWQFEADPNPRFVEGGSQLQLSLGNNEYSADRAGFVLAKAVPIEGLALTASAGEGGNARGSGLLGALSRAVSGTADQAADAYLDVDPAEFSPRAAAEGRRVLRGFVAAIAKP